MARTRTRSVGLDFRRLAAISALAALAAARALAHPAAPGLHVDGPPLGHSGGFGEPTCRACHFDRPLNEPGGSLALVGLPERWVVDRPVRLEIVLSRPRLVRAGFQLSARFVGGDQAGRQAGRFLAEDGRVVVREDSSSGVHYAQHTRAGSEVLDAGEARWRVTWEPAEASAAVTFDLAGNASNDDDSEFGDSIYRRSYTIFPARGSGISRRDRPLLESAGGAAPRKGSWERPERRGPESEDSC